MGQLIRYPQIIVSRGATKIIDFNLSFFNLNGGYISFTIKDRNGNIIKEFQMNTNKINRIVLKDEFTALLFDDTYYYDLMYHLGEERFAQCLPSVITVIDSVGGYEHVI